MANHHGFKRWAGLPAALLSTLLLATGATLPRTAQAQATQRREMAPAAPNTIVGRVTDTLGVPIGGADVALSSLNRFDRFVFSPARAR